MKYIMKYNNKIFDIIYKLICIIIKKSDDIHILKNMKYRLIYKLQDFLY